MRQIVHKYKLLVLLLLLFTNGINDTFRSEVLQVYKMSNSILPAAGNLGLMRPLIDTQPTDRSDPPD